MISNPARFDDEGRLHIEAFHQHHGCPLCPSNLCKGLVLSELLHSHDRVAYVGDGAGDFCPGCDLRGPPECMLSISMMYVMYS